jgi:hypothetical protein
MNTKSSVLLSAKHHMSQLISKPWVDMNFLLLLQRKKILRIGVLGVK